MSAMHFEQDSQPAAPTENAIQRVTKLAQIMVKQERSIAAAEALLKIEKAALLKLQTIEIPELMQELQMKLLGLEDGSIIEIKPDLFCGINDERRTEAHKWLIEHGFGGLIKTEVTASFGKGELEEAEEYVKKANEAFPEHPAAVKDTVHPATLKSFVKEQLAIPSAEVSEEDRFPKALFGVTEFNRAVYKAGKT